MRRKRHRETKVWHDPHMTAAGRRKQQRQQAAEASRSEEARGDGRSKRKRRIKQRTPESKREGVRIIAGASGVTDPKEAERERLLNQLLTVEGRPAISRAAQAYLDAGFEFPRNQYVWLQLLEHVDEQTVSEAIEQLGEILQDEAPARRAVLDSRLRRIEEYADEHGTRGAAGDLRRLIKGRWASQTSQSNG